MDLTDYYINHNKSVPTSVLQAHAIVGRLEATINITLGQIGWMDDATKKVAMDKVMSNL